MFITPCGQVGRRGCPISCPELRIVLLLYAIGNVIVYNPGFSISPLEETPPLEVKFFFTDPFFSSREGIRYLSMSYR